MRESVSVGVEASESVVVRSFTTLIGASPRGLILCVLRTRSVQASTSHQRGCHFWARTCSLATWCWLLVVSGPIDAHACMSHVEILAFAKGFTWLYMLVLMHPSAIERLISVYPRSRYLAAFLWLAACRRSRCPLKGWRDLMDKRCLNLNACAKA